jgi:hypothetical protein
MNKEIIILFAGLIVHVNQPGAFDFNNTAVLPRSGNHAAVLLVEEASLANTSVNWNHLQLPLPVDHHLAIANSVFNTTAPVLEMPLDQVRIRVDGTRGMFSKQEADFQRSVPSLKTQQPNCQLRDEVKNRQFVIADDGDNVPAFAAFIDYRGGTRKLKWPCSSKLAFPNSRWSRPRCVACVTEYRAAIDGNYVTLHVEDVKNNTTYEVKVKGRSTILIANVPPPMSAMAESHIPLHFAVVKNCAVPEAEIGGTCGGGYSPQIPNGDCTNSGYP